MAPAPRPDVLALTLTRPAEVNRVLLRVLILNLVVAGAKLVFGYATGAVSIISDGFHSLTDSASNIVGLIGLRASQKPPDADHPYGHRKYRDARRGRYLHFSPACRRRSQPSRAASAFGGRGTAHHGPELCRHGGDARHQPPRRALRAARGAPALERIAACRRAAHAERCAHVVCRARVIGGGLARLPDPGSDRRHGCGRFHRPHRLGNRARHVERAVRPGRARRRRHPTGGDEHAARGRLPSESARAARPITRFSICTYGIPPPCRSTKRIDSRT